MTRKTVKKFGSHGRGVRVFVETFADARREELIRVQWREGGRLKTESLPNSRENQAKAKAFAEGVAERLALVGAVVRQRLTMRELGERFLLAHPTPETWRPKTRTTWLARWKVWITFAAPDRAIDTVTPDTLDDFRKALREQRYAINQVANMVQMVKSVYRFARERKYLSENAIADYRMKLSRDQRRMQVPEWTPEECAKIIRELDPRSPRRWRAYVAIVLDALLGPRSNALLHLELRDVDLVARTVRWRPEFDKLGNDRLQPLPRDAVRAFRVAAVWRRRIGYAGPYIIPGDEGRRKQAGRAGRPWTYQSLNQALRSAASRAGVRWVDYKAMHAFRRMVVNNVLALTGSIARAGQFIGDSDLRTLSASYVRPRAEELRDVADRIALAPRAPRQKPPPSGTPRRKPQPNRNAQHETAPTEAPRDE